MYSEQRGEWRNFKKIFFTAFDWIHRNSLIEKVDAT